MPEITLTFSATIDGREYTVGSNFIHPFTMLVITHPNKHGLTYDMVFMTLFACPIRRGVIYICDKQGNTLDSMATGLIPRQILK